ncbi:MAG: PAS domain-containing protein [Alphaproteobacteria bacterium]
MLAFAPDDPPCELAATPRLMRLLELWRGWRGTRPAPEREDLDPLALRDLLPSIVLLDVLDDDFRFRLVGESVNERYRHQPKGRTLRDLLHGNALIDTLHEHRLCADSMQAVLVRNSDEAASLEDFKVYTRLLLPVGVDHGRARHILGAMEFRVAGT